MSHAIKHIYFDIGGVLVDYKHDLQTLAQENGITVGDFDDVFDRFDPKLARGELSLQDLWKHYHDDLHLKEPVTFDFREYWINHLEPIAENHQLVRELSQNYSIGIISNLYVGVFPQLIKKQKIPDVPYQVVVASCEEKVVKPQKQIYTIAQEKTGRKPEEILYIDDNPHFIKKAKMLGWNGIYYDKDETEDLRTLLQQLQLL